MPNDKIARLKEVIGLIQRDTITPSELEKFLLMVVQTIKQTNDSFKGLSEANLKQITDALVFIENKYAETLADVDTKNTKLSKDVQANIKELRLMIDEVKAIEVRDGFDGKDGRDGVDGKDGKDGSPDTAEQIKEKLETLEGEGRLDASAIKGLEQYATTQAFNDGLTQVLNRIRLTRGVRDVIAGTNITVSKDGDGNVTVNSTGGGDGSGDVVGPASAVDSNFAAFDTTTGKLIKDSGSKASDFATANHNHTGVYAPVLGADDNYMTDAEKTKLAGIADNANNYTLPTASAGTLGGIKVGSRLSIADGVLSADVQGGTGAVDSVNGQTGTVVLDADDIDDTATTHKFTTAGDITKLAGIETGAEVNNISDVNATDLTDGGATTLHKHSYNNLDDKPTLGDSAAKNVGTTTGTVAAGDHNHTGTYEPANANIQSHISSTSNPHSVTLEQARTANQTLSGQLDIANDTSVYFQGPGGGNGNGFKTGSDGNFLFDVGGNNSVYIKGGDSLGTEKFGYTNASWTGVWNVNTLGNVEQAGDLNLATGKVYKIDGTALNQDHIGDGTTYKQYSATEKTKLAGIEAGANNYTHPATHSADIITDGTTNKAYTATEQTKLAGIAAGAEVNVNADWNAVSGDAQILNKPTLGDSAVKNVGTTTGTVAAGDHNHTGVYKAVGADETANVSAASETAQGKVELATSAEVTTGTDNTRAISPKSLKDAGIVAVTVPVKASGAEVDTGTDDAKFATSKAIADSKLSFTDGAETLTNKTIGDGGYKLGLPSADHTSVGPTTNALNSGATVSAFQLVMLGSASKWILVDADAVATCKGLLGIALEAKNDTQAMNVALPGSFVRDDTWNWTVGATLYAGETPGTMQEAIPTGADAIIKVVGFAVSADVVYFNPSPDQQSTVA